MKGHHLKNLGLLIGQDQRIGVLINVETQRKLIILQVVSRVLFAKSSFVAVAWGT